MLHTAMLHLANIADLCTDTGVRSPLNTVSNVGTFAVVIALFRKISKASITVNDTTVSVTHSKKGRGE